MGQSLFKKHFKFPNFDEIFYYDMTRLRNTNLMFLYNVSTQEPFYETKIWDRVCLRNIQNSKNLMKDYTVE